MNTLGTIATAPVKAISGYTSSVSLPATMDEYYARRRAAEQTVYGTTDNDYNPYGGIFQVNIPYLSQEQILESQDLAADIGNKVMLLVPHIEYNLRRLNPYASEEDIVSRTKEALGSIYTLMLTHAQNQRNRHELLEAVAKGQTTNFTLEQIQQLQQLGLINNKGELIPGAHAAAQASLSATFDDDKNQYPTVFTIASSAKPADYNRQAIADRSAMTGVLDRSVFGPNFTPMYGAIPPPPVAGVKAHISRQGSMSAGLSQPQQINISSPYPRSGSQTVTTSVSPVSTNYSITSKGQYEINPSQMIENKQVPFYLGTGSIHYKKQAAANLAKHVYNYTHDPSKTRQGPSEAAIVAILDRISKKSYTDLNSVKSDMDVLAKIAGANNFDDLIDRIANAHSVSMDVASLRNLSDYLTSRTPSSSSNIIGDVWLTKLYNYLGSIFNGQYRDSQGNKISNINQALDQFRRDLKGQAQSTDADQKAEALYMLLVLAAHDPSIANSIVADPGAPALKQLADATKASHEFANATKQAWREILNNENTNYLYNTANGPWYDTYAGFHGQSFALGLLAAALERYLEFLRVSQKQSQQSQQSKKTP
jgi:hypothetical protein